MQKTFIFAILVTFSLMAKSQDDSTDFTLNNIKIYAAHIESSSSLISQYLEKDKQHTVAQQAEYIKTYIDSIEEEMEYLPDEYYYRLSSLVSSYSTDLAEFEKLLLNNAFENKEKFLANAFANLKQRQTAFLNALHSAYMAALRRESPLGVDPVSGVGEDNTAPDAAPQSGAGDVKAAYGNSVVLVDAIDPHEIRTGDNSLLLDTIHGAQQQIEQYINSIYTAMEKKDFTKTGVAATNVSNASLKISDLSLLLKTDQRESLYILATGLKNLSETLRVLALKGVTAQDEMQECLNKLEIKYNSLSTGISLVQ